MISWLLFLLLVNFLGHMTKKTKGRHIMISKQWIKYKIMGTSLWLEFYGQLEFYGWLGSFESNVTMAVCTGGTDSIILINYKTVYRSDCYNIEGSITQKWWRVKCMVRRQGKEIKTWCRVVKVYPQLLLRVNLQQVLVMSSPHMCLTYVIWFSLTLMSN